VIGHFLTGSAPFWRGLCHFSVAGIPGSGSGNATNLDYTEFKRLFFGVPA
jgi:hypothetical protein